MLSRTRRSVCGRADLPVNVDGCLTDAATGIVNKNGFAGVQRTHHFEQQVSHQVIDGNGRRQFETKRLRFGKKLICGDSDFFRLATEARHCHDRLTCKLPIHTVTNHFNHAGNFITHHARLLWSVRIKPLAREYVSEVQPGSFYLNYNFTLSWCRIRRFLNFQDFNAAVCGSNNLSHPSSCLWSALANSGGECFIADEDLHSLHRWKLSRCCINLRFNTWFVTNSRQRQFARQSYGSCPVNHRNRSDFEIATLPEVFEVGTSLRMLWRLQELANRSRQRRRRLLDSAGNSYQTIFATDLLPGFTVIANCHQIDIDRLTVVRLTVAFENIQQSRAVVVLDVCYSPGSSSREQPKLDLVFLSEILEGYRHHYHPRPTNSLLNREIL